jgi:hypothetical protein
MSKKKIKDTRADRKMRKAKAEKRAGIVQRARQAQMIRDLRALDDLDLLQFLPRPKETSNPEGVTKPKAAPTAPEKEKEIENANA